MKNKKDSVLKIALIAGTHRKDSQSGRIAEFMAGRVKALVEGAETYVLDLGKKPLPLWDESMWGAEGVAKSAWQPVAAELADADAFVILAPEYNGTAPAALKNFFHYAGGKEFAHKPGLIVGVSGSVNGAYPVADVRSFSAKNCKLVYIPDHLVVRHAGEILHEDARDGFGDQDAYMKERMDYSLNVLVEYAKSFKVIRESEAVKNTPQKFAFGQ